MSTRQWVRVSKNRYHILWILILAAALRFVQVGAPPVGRHAWRQCDTASVARNFHHNGYRLLYPQIDWDIPGFVEMEFPVYPWTTSLLYRLFGESAAIARILAILASLVTIVFLYLLVERILGRRAALWSALFYAVLPANLFFGRAIMPESWMLAATTVALYCFLRWTDEESWHLYSLALLATTLACLMKLTSLYLGLPLLWLAWQRWGRGALRRWPIWLFAGAVTTALLLWYGHAYQLGQEFGASFNILTAAGTDKWGTWGLLANPAFYHRVFVGYLGERMLTWAGFPVFCLGLFLRRRYPLERIFDVWLLAVALVLLLANGGSYQHDYYSLPLVLPAVVFMAKVFDRVWESRRFWLVPTAALVLVLSGYRYLGALADERQPGEDSTIAEALAQETAREDLVISCNSANPVWLYLADRRGWGRDCESLGKSELEDLMGRGARYLVLRGSPGSQATTRIPVAIYSRAFFEVLRDDETLLLVQLSSPRSSDGLSWKTFLRENFSAATSIESWSLHGGTWKIEDGSLFGARVRRPAEARTRRSLPACDVCRVRMSLALLTPPQQEPTVAPSRSHRGSGRSDSQTSIELFKQKDGSGVTLSLATKNGSLALHQDANGERLDSSRIDFPVVAGQTLDLELRSNAFDFELFMDGHPVLTTPNRLPTPLSGRFALRPRLGSIRLDSLEIQALKEHSRSPRPRPSQ